MNTIALQRMGRALLVLSYLAALLVMYYYSDGADPTAATDTVLGSI